MPLFHEAVYYHGMTYCMIWQMMQIHINQLSLSWIKMLVTLQLIISSMFSLLKTIDFTRILQNHKTPFKNTEYECTFEEHWIWINHQQQNGVNLGWSIGNSDVRNSNRVILGQVFSCDQAALRTLFSVCLSVCLSHLFDYVPFIVSSWNFQELLPLTKVMSMQEVKVRGQRSRSHWKKNRRFWPKLGVSGL